jgi:hypothetical protein
MIACLMGEMPIEVLVQIGDLRAPSEAILRKPLKTLSLLGLIGRCKGGGGCGEDEHFINVYRREQVLDTILVL